MTRVASFDGRPEGKKHPFPRDNAYQAHWPFSLFPGIVWGNQGRSWGSMGKHAEKRFFYLFLLFHVSGAKALT